LDFSIKDNKSNLVIQNLPTLNRYENKPPCWRKRLARAENIFTSEMLILAGRRTLKIPITQISKPSLIKQNPEHHARGFVF